MLYLDSILFLSIVHVCFQNVRAISRFDNSVVGSPLVSCEESEIRIELETMKPFNGKVFVKGEYYNDHCSKTYYNGAASRSSNNGNSNHEDIDHFLTTTSSLINGDDDQQIINKLNKNVITFDDSPNQMGAPENSSWTGAGGSTDHRKINRMPFTSAFGGSKSEHANNYAEMDSTHIKIFPKSLNQKADDGDLKKLPPLAKNNQVCPPCSCEPVDRRRRNTNHITFVVPLGQCSAKRERILNPSSLITSFVIIVSFHESFITKLDRAYHIQCAYTESSRPVAAELNVSMSAPFSLNSSITPPKCEYDIRGSNGKAIQDVRVGDLVHHEWKCHTEMPGLFKMLIHDCYVESGSHEKYKIIDEEGCTMDKYTLATPTYSNSLTATVESFMFKFPDKSAVDFQCAIKLCSIHDSDCVIKTPPQCDEPSRKRRHVNLRGKNSDYVILNSNSLTVLDKDDANKDYLEHTMNTPEAWHLNMNVCFSVTQFGFLISSVTFLSTLSLAIFFAHTYFKIFRF